MNSPCPPRGGCPRKACFRIRPALYRPTLIFVSQHPLHPNSLGPYPVPPAPHPPVGCSPEPKYSVGPTWLCKPQTLTFCYPCVCVCVRLCARNGILKPIQLYPEKPKRSSRSFCVRSCSFFPLTYCDCRFVSDLTSHLACAQHTLNSYCIICEIIMATTMRSFFVIQTNGMAEQ